VRQYLRLDGLGIVLGDEVCTGEAVRTPEDERRARSARNVGRRKQHADKAGAPVCGRAQRGRRRHGR